MADEDPENHVAAGLLKDLNFGAVVVVTASMFVAKFLVVWRFQGL